MKTTAADKSNVWVEYMRWPDCAELSIYSNEMDHYPFHLEWSPEKRLHDHVRPQMAVLTSNEDMFTGTFVSNDVDLPDMDGIASYVISHLSEREVWTEDDITEVVSKVRDQWNLVGYEYMDFSHDIDPQTAWEEICSGDRTVSSAERIG